MKSIKNVFLIATTLLLFISPEVSYCKKPIKVACIGNSITYGTGIANRAHDSYPSQLQRMLGDDYQVGNFGRPGATLLNHGHRPYVKQPEYAQAKEFLPDVAVFHLGINDTDPRNWPNFRDEFVKDYLDLIESFRQINPDTRIIIARMTPIADRHPRFISGTKQWHGLIQSAIESIAEIAEAELIDFHEPLYPYPWMLPDALHPNVEGASILAKTVYAALTGNYGGLQLSEMYTDYMVLQRNVPLTLQGIADAGSKVTVKIDGQKESTTANCQGKWQITLEPLQAGDNYQLEISTRKEEKVFKHVAAGEVWLCSGQSNMEFMLNQCITANDAKIKGNNPSIRLFNKKANWRTNNENWPVSAIDSINHLLYYKETQWQACTPENASRFSAIAYYFGQMLQDSLQVPVGLICNAIGGATTESWIDRNTLETEFPAILKDWLHNDFIQGWARERAEVNLKLSKSAIKRHPYEPCYLYESGIRSLQQYPIKGVIWYQGESNAHNMEAHEKLFPLLVKSWRSNWNNPEMPFYYVQLSSLNRPSWPWFRDSQRRMMNEINDCGMAVSSDKGDSLDVHPRNKRPIGERLARWALADTYHRPILASGPLFESAASTDDEVCLTFSYADGLHGLNGKEIQGFEVAEHDGLFYPAKATVVDNQVILVSAKVKRPRFVRYGWQPFTRANLVNKDELPASTFRTEL